MIFTRMAQLTCDYQLAVKNPSSWHVSGLVSCPPQAGKSLEEQCRDKCGNKLAELFPTDTDTARAKEDLESMIKKLQAFKERPRTVAASGLEVVMLLG